MKYLLVIALFALSAKAAPVLTDRLPSALSPYDDVIGESSRSAPEPAQIPVLDDKKEEIAIPKVKEDLEKKETEPLSESTDFNRPKSFNSPVPINKNKARKTRFAADIDNYLLAEAQRLSLPIDINLKSRKTVNLDNKSLFEAPVSPRSPRISSVRPWTMPAEAKNRFRARIDIADRSRRFYDFENWNLDSLQTKNEGGGEEEEEEMDGLLFDLDELQ